METLYVGNQVDCRMDEIIPAYQAAFAGPPWNERSKCTDEQKRCIGGFSLSAVGEQCGTCERVLLEEAYTSQELLTKFSAINTTKEALWYVEDTEKGLALTALAWKTTADVIATEKYGDDPNMRPWLNNLFGDQPFVWLDEVFANKKNRDSENLANFRAMNEQFADTLGAPLIAYRTITPQMVTAAKRKFNTAPISNVPDRRNFIVLDTGNKP